MLKSEFLRILPDSTVESPDSLRDAIEKLGEPGYVWFNLVRASREELMELASPLNLHPLSLEDCTDEAQVPKVDEFQSYTFIVFNALRYEHEELASDEVDIFIGRNFLVTTSGYSANSGFPLEGILQVAERNLPTVSKGPAWLMHIILDYIVDQMADSIDGIETDIDQAEEVILGSPSSFSPSKLIYLRRNLLDLRKSLFHEREILIKISRNDYDWVPEKATVHYRDILDHISNFLEMTESNRDNVTSLMELYASMMNNKMARDANQTNATVRRLTIITTIFMPLTLLAGIFGMSEWTMLTGGEGNMRHSYPLLAVIMAGIGVASYMFIRWLEWRDRKRSG